MIKIAALSIGTIAAVLMTSAGLQAVAQQDQSQTVDVEALTCKQVMILSGADRDTTISYIHGYVAGKHGHGKVDLDALTVATEAFVNDCLDAPTANAVATLEKLLNQ